MKRILTLLAIALAASFTVHAGCEGGSCVGHKGKFEGVPTPAQMQS